MTDERDRELDDLLAPLRETKAHDVELARWQRAVREELERSPTRLSRWMQLTAAAAVGFALGAFTLGPLSRHAHEPSFGSAEATVEYVYRRAE